MNRRGLLTVALAACVAPAIVRAESLMKVVVQKSLVTDVKTFFLPCHTDPADPAPNRAYAGATGLIDGREYGVLYELTDPYFEGSDSDPNWVMRYAEHQFRTMALSRSRGPDWFVMMQQSA